MANRPLERVSTLSPPAIEVLSKTVQVARTDTTAFDAFSLPKGAVLVGAYVMGTVASDSLTSAIISLGTNPGTSDDVVSAFSVKTSGVGYFAAGAQAGTKIGTQLTSDTLVKAKYTEVGASTTGGPWLVKAEYYFPQSGTSW